jgi:hypothetical protein
MGLFKSSDIMPGGGTQAGQEPAAMAVGFKAINRFITGEKLQVLQTTIGSLNPDECIHFKTAGAWSNIHILEYILMQTGPANIYFTTWSISAEAIARFTEWENQGTAKQIFAVLDAGIRNRKPELYQQSIGAFANLAITHVHAKVTVVQNLTHHITLMGSANFTRNPRIETGCVTWNKALANAHIQWILEEFKNG